MPNPYGPAQRVLTGKFLLWNVRMLGRLVNLLLWAQVRIVFGPSGPRRRPITWW